MPAKKFDLWSSIGVTGVQEYAGILSDRYAETLRGQAGIQKMARVLRREPAAFTSWNMVLLASASARWSVTPAADSKADQDCADFVQSNLDDMSHSWQDAVRFAMSAWPFGFADHEIVWKKRLGQNPGRDLPTSKWDDGLVGVRKLAPRRQETIYQWVNDEHGGKQAMIQQDPTTGKNLPEIPIEKLLHYVGGDERGSWEGLGWLEPAYWLAYLAEQLEQIGGATAQRGGTGLPVFKFLAPPDTTTQSTVDEIGEGLTASELQYVKLPGPMVEFDLKTVSLSNLGDIRGWIDQLRWEIAALVAATFVRLGSTERGTQSLGGTMYDAFTLGIDGCLDGVTDVWNRYLIPRLLANNPGEFQSISDHPRITHSKITTLPPATAQWLKNVSEFMGAAAPEDVEWVRAFMGMPFKSAKDIAAAQEEKAKAEEAAQKQAQALAAKQAAAQQPQTEQKVAPQPGEQPATAAGPKAAAGTEQPEAPKQPAETAEYPAAVREALLAAAARIVSAQYGEDDVDLFNPLHYPRGRADGGQDHARSAGRETQART